MIPSSCEPVSCQLKDIAAADAILLACLGATALLTVEIAFFFLVEFVGRMKQKHKANILRRWPS